MHKQGCNVLVAVGDADRRERLAVALSGVGGQIHQQAGLSAAATILSRGKIDVAVVDLVEDFEALSAIARAAEGAGTTLLAIGDASETEPLVLAMRLGARECIAADATGETVAMVVKRWLIARENSRPPGDQADENRRLKAQHEDLRRHVAEQIRSFEDAQEAFYLDLSRMMTIIGNIMDGIVFVDQHGSIALMNPVAEDLIGVKSFIAIGKHVTDLTGRREVTRALQEDHRLVADRKEVVRTIEIHHAEQDLLYIKACTTKVLDYRGSAAGVLTVLQDVTSEYKSDQLKNQYLSIVAHELRTPLTGIKTFSTVMSKGALGELNAKQKEVMAAIREQSLRLEHQIDKLINLGQIDSNSFGQDLEDFDVDEFATTACAPFELVAKDRGIEIALVGLGGGIRAHADRTDLKRALQALIENAVKFTPDHGRVELRVGEQDGYVTFTVADDGIGIDPRYHRRVFEKFFQVEDPLTRHHGGAGLGLFVARGIVEAHGSKIEVRSELGQGAEFSFRVKSASPVDDEGIATSASGAMRETRVT